MDGNQPSLTGEPCMHTGLKQFFRAAAALLFPANCLVCGSRLPDQPAVLFCERCLETIKLLRRPLCTRCGKPFPHAAGTSHPCSACLKKPPHYDLARGILTYEEPVARLIHAFKYHRSTVGLGTFRAMLQQLPHLQTLPAPDLIIPVPLHPRKLRQRGYNQALLLAKCFFPEHKKRIRPMLLARKRDTAPQINLSGAERRKNLKNAFLVKNPEEIKGRRVLLIDDVFTTGTTVNECARVLKRAGAREVRVLTLARVPY